jgi:hypothetical protein
MSFLYNPPHIATVYAEESAIDSYGNSIKRASSTGVVVRCAITPSSSSRDTNQGGPIDATYRFIARSAPIGSWSRVEWNNITFTVDSVKYFDLTPESTHVEAVLRQER